MPKSPTRPRNVICLASYFKGGDFIKECKQLGCHVILVTKEKMLKEDWPHDSLADLIAVPNDAEPALFIDLAAYISRKVKPDLVIALEEFDVLTAALIREHLCLPGMSSSTAKNFRDKSRMGTAARAAKVEVPDFVSLINPDDVRDFMARAPAPWIIKPRSDVSAIGIRKVAEPEQVWRAIDELNERENLRERASYYLLAEFIAGEVFHVDSVVGEGRVLFACANRYGRPPMEVAHQGGAYISRTIAHRSDDERKLFEVNRKLIKAFGLRLGAAHAEFIKSDADGKFYFLEMASRVGGAYIAEVLEAASGLNLWREWARIEVNGPRASSLKPTRNDYAGIVLSLARQENPDTDSYDDPEIVYRVKKRHHAGLIVRSPKLDRVEELLAQYAGRFAEDFVAIVPPLEKAE